MTLNQLADELTEIRRYVRSNPEHVKERSIELKAMKMQEPWSSSLERLLDRLRLNTDVGVHRIHSNPEILEGYLYGAAAEIRELAAREDGAK